ncbi:hypothetical protein [Nitrosomonas sp.]
MGSLRENPTQIKALSRNIPPTPAAVARQASLFLPQKRALQSRQR